MILRLWRPGLVRVCGRSGPWESFSVFTLLSSPLRSHPLLAKLAPRRSVSISVPAAAAAPGEDGWPIDSVGAVTVAAYGQISGPISPWTLKIYPDPSCPRSRRNRHPPLAGYGADEWRGVAPESVAVRGRAEYPAARRSHLTRARLHGGTCGQPLRAQTT